MPLYFAYGSNMDRAAMAERCPDARVVGPARLERHRLAIMREGYATVVHDARKAVHGLLWEVPFADVLALDRYEGVATRLYTKRQQPVVTASGVRKALVYIGSNAGPGVPVAGYVEGVLAAAVDLGLPPGAITDIAALGARGTRAAAPSGPVARVRPTRATPHDAARPVVKSGWRWTP